MLLPLFLIKSFIINLGMLNVVNVDSISFSRIFSIKNVICLVLDEIIAKVQRVFNNLSAWTRQIH